MMTELLIRCGALTHLGLAAAGLLMPRVTGLWAEARTFTPFARGLFRTYYMFIGFCLVSFGIGTWFLAEHLADGSVLARAVCAFLAGFWILRVVAAVWLIDVSPFLTNVWYRIGYHTLNVVFSGLPLIYFWVAFKK
ncbi:hypothetical protein [Rariglobus hedericola]|uniref:DUF4345 domain-containing protein n=1 Tax=Rariglobus hedericola TaxID=2597822 RepID=A0A556QGR9_9BACT|nr:hypothetical protein [Rariglobus hedericola]TSJ75834.1 hypothetical protein FPL22_16375 [Rariglobus hedericola]